MQQAAEVDLDRLVDYKTEYCSVIKKHKITGDNLTGLCPFHDDRANSFSVDLKTGKWHCFAEDEGGNFVTFYAKLNGLDTKEAYKQILEKYGALNEPQEKPKEKKPGLDHYTVSQYSFEKRLPEDWLKEQCCLQTKKDRNGVQYLYIPYFDAERNLALHRKRYGGKQFRWEYGKTDRLCMYGLWQIEAIRNIGYAACRAGQRRGSIPRQSHKGTPGRKVRRRSIQMELPDTWMQGPIGSLYEVWQRGSGREDPKSNQQRRADRHRGGQYPGSSRGSTCELKTAGRLDLFRKGNQRD